MQSKASPDPIQAAEITCPASLASQASEWLRIQGCLVLSEPPNGLPRVPHRTWGLSSQDSCTQCSFLALRKEVPIFSFLEKPQVLEMHFSLRLGWLVVCTCRPELCPTHFFCGHGLCQSCCCTSPVPSSVAACTPSLCKGTRPSKKERGPQPALRGLHQLWKGAGQPWLLLPSGNCRAQTGPGEQPRRLGGLCSVLMCHCLVPTS